MMLTLLVPGLAFETSDRIELNSQATIHANLPQGALEQIALMAMQSNIGLTRRETIEYAASVIDVVVQLDRNNGTRGITVIAEAKSLVAMA